MIEPQVRRFPGVPRAMLPPHPSRSPLDEPLYPALVPDGRPGGSFRVRATGRMERTHRPATADLLHSLDALRDSALGKQT